MTEAPSIGGSLQEVRPGRTLHVAVHDSGSDTTLFFIHGGGGNKAQFRFQWQHFSAQRLNLVAWDAVGHGRSPQPKIAAAYAGAELVGDARAVFLAHRTKRNIFVAHSYGARLALAWLIEDVSHGKELPADDVVLLGAAPLGKMGKRLLPGLLGWLPLPLLELARPILSEGFRKRAWDPGADPALVKTEQEATRGNSLFMMQSLLAGAPPIDDQALAKLLVPVLLLAGESDGLVPLAASEKLASLLPRASLQRVEKCGHQIMMEAPEVTNRAIESVLAGGAVQLP
jgi:pimeloyl-ACP methyl ester carboxylesterase